MSGSYEFATGSVRAREIKLLREQDIEQLINAGTLDRLVGLLKDKGYSADGDIDRMLELHMADTWDYIRSVAPDFSLFNCFILRNDAHNVKLIIKGILRGRKYENLIMTPYTVDPDDIKTAVPEQKTEHLPEWLRDAVEKSCDAVASGDAQLADAVIDKAVMEHMLSEVKLSGVDFLYRYISAAVFYYNVKTLIRAAKMHKSPDFIKNAVCACDGMDTDEMAKAAVSGLNELFSRLSSVGRYGVASAVDAYKESPSSFEKYVDDRLLSEAEICKTASSGPMPILGYFIAKETEIKVIHIIASGIRTGSSPDEIRERVRRVYG